MQDVNLLAQHPADNEHRFDQCHQVGDVLDELFNTRLKLDRAHDADLETKVTQTGTQIILNGDGLRLQQLTMGQQRAQRPTVLAAAPRSTMSSPLPYCRTNQTSSDVGMIGIITASARHRWTYRRRNGTKRKFFNDFSRARMRARARKAAFRVCVPSRNLEESSLWRASNAGWPRSWRRTWSVTPA